MRRGRDVGRVERLEAAGDDDEDDEDEDEHDEDVDRGQEEELPEEPQRVRRGLVGEILPRGRTIAACRGC